MESRYLQIKTKQGEIRPLELNFAQVKLLALINKLKAENKPIRIIILKARQLGISTEIDAIIYAETSKATGVNSLICADDVDGSNYLLEIVKLYQEGLPEHLKPKEKKSNEKKLEFENTHSQILIDTANNEKCGRKYTYRYAHLSEVAFFPPEKTKVLMNGLLASVPKLPETMVFMESTANGIGNYFEDEWNKAERGESDWSPLFIAWFENPAYVMSAIGFELTEREVLYKSVVKANTGVELSNEQMAFRRYVIANDCAGDEKLFEQEYPAFPAQAFLVSGRPRFDIEVLKTLRANQRNPIRKEGNWDIFEEPLPNIPYIIGADTADNNENSCNSIAQVLNPLTYKVVAKFRGKIEPEQFGLELVVWGNKYNQAHIAVEANNHGLTTLTAIKNKQYSNIYERKIYDERAQKWTKKIGWLTTPHSKPFLIDNLASALRGGLTTHSSATIDELFTFVVNDDGTCSAQEGKHDDEVMSLAVTNQAFMEGQWKEIKPKEPAAPKGSVAYELQKLSIEQDDWRAKYRGN